jgi:uncharacterized iron-regulated protein
MSVRVPARARHHGLALALVCASVAACATAPATAPAILLLGEVHDNPDGHRQRFEQLRTRVDAGWRPAIAMEQFDRDKQAVLTDAQASCPDADCIIAKAGNPKSWQWPLYWPVIALAQRYKLTLLAANLSRADAGLVMKGGLAAALDPATIAAFRLGEPLPAGLVAAQEAEIIAAHCGQLPPQMAPGMALAQIARDVWMTKTVIDHRQAVVLLAGNGHVRRDIGVGRWLGTGAAASSEAYLEASSNERAAYDIVHPIAPHQRPDPCTAMGKIGAPATVN